MRLTPLDTGDVLEPKLWEGERPDDEIGRVDFDDDAGETQVTLRLERTSSGYVIRGYAHGDFDLEVDIDM